MKQHVGKKTFQNCYFQYQELDISQTTGSCLKNSKLSKDFIQEIPGIHCGSCSDSYPAPSSVLRATLPCSHLKMINYAMSSFKSLLLRDRIYS